MNPFDVFVEKRPVYYYPDSRNSFSPSLAYPEYPWESSTLSEQDNQVYDMVRSCLIGLKLDEAHLGTEEWNPLGDIIHSGDTVLIKPNLVMHKNGIIGNGTECVYTHPSVIRAVADYVAIALRGRGKCIIGDAPLQSCDFDRLIRESGLQSLADFYKANQFEIELLDFRLVKVETRRKIPQRIYTKSENKEFCMPVDLGEKSMFVSLPQERLKQLRVTNYDPGEMRKHHRTDKHEYLIACPVLEADVIINLPKPKTHRLAGVTAALKNLVGINANKNRLPHHTEGALTENGDEFQNKSWLKVIIRAMQRYFDCRLIHQGRRPPIVLVHLRQALTVLARHICKDPFFYGFWFGNDTIWRTILDLNYILKYADKAGKLQNSMQRRVFHLGDMIVAGEKEGPLEPTPKPCGIVLAAFDAAAFDKAVCAIMGFSDQKIPSIREAWKVREKEEQKPMEPVILSNEVEWNEKTLTKIAERHSLRFEPCSGWKGHIEV